MATLVVIGNGFDLNIGMESHYTDYFESNEYKVFLEFTKAWISLNGNCINEQEYARYSCWDIVFYFEFYMKNTMDCQSVNWFNIEQLIHDSLVKNLDSDFLFTWEKVYKDLNKHYINRVRQDDNTDLEYKVLYNYFINTEYWGEELFSKKSFYNALLTELNKFEKRFGEYILYQSGRDNINIEAKKLLYNLKQDVTEYYIDSFNYSRHNFCDEFRYRHVNGDFNNPIFGIKLDRNEADKLIYPFTKTYRRIKQDAANSSDRVIPKDIDKVIVFGHSLNEQDYDYFAYIFTLLKFNTFDIEKMGSIEFRFSIYDPKKERKIIKNNVDAVNSLLLKYEAQVSPGNYSVLTNLLRFSGKLVVKEINKNQGI